MAKTKIMTDSASDVSVEQAAQYDITLMNFWLVVGDNSCRENVDYTTEEFYDVLAKADDLPHTSQITVDDYSEAYEKEYNNGVTDLINVAIASIGSNSYNNACAAKNAFFENHPEAQGKINITVIDSKAYTGAYGLPVIMAAKLVQNGSSADEVIAFLKEWSDCAVIICTAYSLKYAKKSGRVGCATAFVGDLLGIRPVIVFEDAVSRTAAKVRGDKNVIPQLTDYAIKNMTKGTPYAILDGCNHERTAEITELMTKLTGYAPEVIHHVGATIACHLGPDVCGIIIKGANRSTNK